MKPEITQLYIQIANSKLLTCPATMLGVEALGHLLRGGGVLGGSRPFPSVGDQAL